MKNGQVKVVGISKYEKDGKVSYTLHGYTPFEAYEAENAVGFKSVNEWTNRVDLSSLKPDDLVELHYGKGFQGKAVLVNVTVVQSSK